MIVDFTFRKSIQVHRTFMTLKKISFIVLTSTELAFVRFFSCMLVYVLRQLRLNAETILAEIAFEALHSCVPIHVNF